LTDNKAINAIIFDFVILLFLVVYQILQTIRISLNVQIFTSLPTPLGLHTAAYIRFFYG